MNDNDNDDFLIDDYHRDIADDFPYIINREKLARDFGLGSNNEDFNSHLT